MSRYQLNHWEVTYYQSKNAFIKFQGGVRQRPYHQRLCSNTLFQIRKQWKESAWIIYHWKFETNAFSFAWGVSLSWWVSRHYVRILVPSTVKALCTCSLVFVYLMSIVSTSISTAQTSLYSPFLGCAWIICTTEMKTMHYGLE